LNKNWKRNFTIMPSTEKAILHYSFDLWLTLIKSNPGFKPARSRYFQEHFNRQGKTLEEVTAVFRRIDLLGNSINECVGKNLEAEEMYLMVIHELNGEALPLREVNLPALQEAMEALVLEHQPLLYSDDVCEVLAQLQQRPNITMSLLSNTGFIKGETLRKVLVQISLDRFFCFQLYSDEVRLSKPAPAFFDKVVTLAEKHRGATLDRQQILHTGDNAFTDLAGAQHSNMSALLIHSNNVPLSAVLDL
jgi:putative hydrolase of the HAD superfamily